MLRYALGVIAVVAGLWYVDTGAQVVSTNTGGFKFGSTDYLWTTPLGGLAVRMTAGETLVEGNIVMMSNTDRTVRLPVATVDNDVQIPVGLAYAAANPGQDVWIVTGGIATCQFAAAETPVVGYFVHPSITSGQNGKGDADQSAPGASATIDHNGEIGHCIEGGTAGSLKKIILHFN